MLQMLKDNPKDCFLNYAIALEYAKEGENEKAISIFEVLITEEANYLATYYQLGKLYEVKGEIQKALDVYRKGIGIAKQKEDVKTIGELEEALMILD